MEVRNSELTIQGQEEYGCKHYERKCQFMTPCCKKLYTCRFCHDENENHVLNRKDVTHIQCLKCSTSQKIQQNCSNCNVTFGQYFCPICKLFDDKDKKQYHCVGCGICRIGGRDNFFHCDKCNMCLPIKMNNKHKCIENVSRTNCPVCLEDLHTSRIPSHIPPCGHLIHKNCYEEMLRSGNYACPLCSTSMVDMTVVWGLIDNEINSTPMPEEYANHIVWILCRDCHKDSEVKFHVLGLKCNECGGYNTCRTKSPDLSSSDRRSSVNFIGLNDPAVNNSVEENGLSNDLETFGFLGTDSTATNGMNSSSLVSSENGVSDL